MYNKVCSKNTKGNSLENTLKKSIEIQMIKRKFLECFHFISITCLHLFVGLVYQGKDIVFRFIIEYSSVRDFGPEVIGLFLYENFGKI